MWRFAALSILAAVLPASAQTKLVTPVATTTGSNGYGLYFDLSASGAEVKVTEFTSYFTQNAGLPVEVHVYVTPGGYAGKTEALTGWTVIGVGAGKSAGQTTLTQPIDIPDIIIPAGQTVGVCFVQTVGYIRYHVGPSNPTTYTTGPLSLSGGVSKSNPFSAVGQAFEPRVFSGELYFESSGTGCYPDCDQTGSLDFFDFLCFTTSFTQGQTYADCDVSGTLDFFDFLCFQTEFQAGCP